MEKYNVVIGIEIHIELNTKSKMFSSARNSFDNKPNENVSLVDVAYPGTLPTPNKEAVVKAIKLAKALKMEIDNELHFDRKNYFYPDLPKGFQITQQFRPIGKNGTIEINANGEKKNISIERIHLEEDTAKQLHTEKGTFLDYNRAGVPLIEIVTNPVMSSAEEAANYVDAIRKTALYLDISDAKLEEGSLRVDVNISLNKKGDSKFGTKVEIKNINSISNVRKAIEYEIQLQSQMLDNNQLIEQETKRFDDVNNVNKTMRKKSGNIDYKYFPEPNIPFIELPQEFLDSITIPMMFWEKESEYQKADIAQIYINQLLNDLEFQKFFDSIDFADKNKLSKFFFSEIVPLIKSNGINNLLIKNSDISKILVLLDEDKISSKQAKELVVYKNNENLSIEEIIEKYQLKQSDNSDEIESIVEKLIIENPEKMEEFKTRPEKVIKFFLGQIMKETKGKSNPQKANEIVLKKLS